MLDVMLSRSRKFLALLLAVWLPLFSGYALADSILMQPMMNGDCRTAMQQVSQPAQHGSAMHEHMQQKQLSGNTGQPYGQPHSQDPACNDCGVCQLACSGYFAVTAIEMKVIEPSSQSFTPFTTEFQSVTTAPLDPPPLARV